MTERSGGYVYRRATYELYTVGYWSAGEWTAESDHRTAEKAAARVHWLNGGLAREEIEQFADVLCRALAERVVRVEPDKPLIGENN